MNKIETTWEKLKKMDNQQLQNLIKLQKETLLDLQSLLIVFEIKERFDPIQNHQGIEIPL